LENQASDILKFTQIIKGCPDCHSRKCN